MSTSMYLALPCKFVKIMRKNVMFFFVQHRVTGIFNITRSGNIQEFTSYHTNFLDFRF